MVRQRSDSARSRYTSGVTPGLMVRLKTCGKPPASDCGRFFVARVIDFASIITHFAIFVNGFLKINIDNASFLLYD